MAAGSPDGAPARWFGPGELARRLGISIKALRVYEQAGLVVPGRREGGWRTYGPADVARLHELLALRSLGLSLAEVGEALATSAGNLDRTLGLQQRHLAAQIATAQKRLATVNAARRRLREDGSLGIDELLSLSSETAAAPPISADQVEAIINAHAAYQPQNSDLSNFQNDLRAQLAKLDIDHAQFEREVSRLVADASLAAQDGDSAGERGRELAGRWLDLAALLAPVSGQRGEVVREGVALFAATLKNDPDLAAALAFLKNAVAAHPASSEAP